MKKLAMLLLALFVVFGLSSAPLAAGKEDKGNTSTTEKVTYHKGVTTIVTTKKEVTHDKIVKTEKSTNKSVKKKSDKSTYNEVKTDIQKEEHPKKDKYREVKTETTYKVTKKVTWDEVTKVHTIKKFITPVKITKTTVTTVKHKGKPGSKGKVISKHTDKSVDKKHGKTEKKVSKEKETEKKNEKVSFDKKVIDVKVTKGKWVKKRD